MPRLPKRANLYGPQGFGGETIGVCTTKRHTKKQVAQSYVSAEYAAENIVAVNGIGGIGKGFQHGGGGGLVDGHHANELICNELPGGNEAVDPTTIGNLSAAYVNSVMTEQRLFDDAIKGLILDGIHTNISTHTPQFTEPNTPTVVSTALGLDDWIAADTMLWASSALNPLGKNMMPYIWNQGHCGCCWAMGTAWSLLTCATIQSNYWAVGLGDTSLYREPQSMNIPYLINACAQFQKITNINLGALGVPVCSCNGGEPIIAIGTLVQVGMLSDGEAAAAGFPPSCYSNRRCGCNKNGVLSAQQTCSPCGIKRTCPDPLFVSSGESHAMFIDRGENIVTRFGPLGYKGVGTVRQNLQAKTLKAILVNIGPVFVAVNADALNPPNIPYLARLQQVLLPTTALKPIGKGPNHCVQVVGWLRYDGKEYWAVQNQWGLIWGYRGFALVEVASPEYDVCTSFYEVGFLSAKSYLNEDGTPTLKTYNSPATPGQWINQPCGVCPE